MPGLFALLWLICSNRRSEQPMTNLFTKIYNFENPHAQILPTPDGSETQSGASTQSNGASLQPIKNWSHPFRDKRDPFSQLAHLAKAAGGGYPLGGNGLWHGGVHFDGGTAGTVDQSSVHCLADGEVVAYRVDEQSPTTPYFFNKMAVNKPFSRNFVLVRHRLQPPKIEGNPDSPPSLVFYSLYMHLQDWAVYHADATIARPGFWAAGSSLHVKDDVADLHVDHPGQKGLNVRNQARKGKIVGWLPRGAEVTVTGNGDFRKLENTLGPDALIAANGSLKGYVSARYLSAISDGQHRIQCKNILNVRAEASQHSDIIFELPAGTEVTVSGQGAYRKLERINQYVHYKSLRGGAAEPQTCDSVVVLGKPVAIKAGDLIGHIGEHQEGNAERPENRLHLEVFSGDDVEMFFKLSALWAARMPASGKTWLKLVEGTPVVTHQASFTSKQPPTLKAASRPSAAQLLVPKSLLDGLPADWKIAVAASGDTKACNWYRLDGLLHDDTNTLLDGWVCEEVGVTPWVSPWSWEGYVALFNYDSPRNMMASFKRAVGLMKEEELTRYGGMADSVDKGPIKNRLYDIIDRNKDGHITAAEVQGALMLPAHAQSLSQLIVYYESEWRHTPHKWDELDELLGHSGSTPNKNWLAEKERIKQTSWWGDVASRVGLPAHGKVYHMHPLGMLGQFSNKYACLALADSIALALRVSGGYEGRSKLDYHALADDFDGQGTSFGLIQWNFGQGTLGPVLLKMYNENALAFASCFPGNTNYEQLKEALINGDSLAQINWARDIIKRNRSGWAKAFNALGDVPNFQKIQLREAAKFHSNVEACVKVMRSLSPLLMAKVSVISYVALYDLCVQQGGLDKGQTLKNIEERIRVERPVSQEQLLIVCVQERAKTASSRWAADCWSRRMGIIERQPYTANFAGHTATRKNANFEFLSANKDGYVCEL
jgi:hypothetical protein